MIKAIAERPWILIIAGCVLLLLPAIALVVISAKYGPKEVPVSGVHSDY